MIFPTNRGGLCQKGWTATDLLDHPERLLYTLIRDGKSGELRLASWDEALDRIVDGIRTIQDRYGKDAIGVFSGGGLTNEKSLSAGLAVPDIFLSETAKLADVVLPCTQWAEEEGTMTNLEGRVLFHRRVMPPLPQGALVFASAFEPSGTVRIWEALSERGKRGIWRIAASFWRRHSRLRGY